jgi:hypothetical protein
MSIRPILATVLAALAFSAEASAKTHHAGAKSYNVSDAALVKTLPGFNSSFAIVKGIRIMSLAARATRCFCFRAGPRRGGAITRLCPSSRRDTA